VSTTLAAARAAAPDAARRLVQLAADNPAQMAVLVSGAYLAGGLAARLVRPRGPLELAALLIVLNAGIGWGLPRLLDSGVIRLKVRDEDGHLRSLHGKPELVFCGLDCPGHTTGIPGESCLKS
jgi:hypothetical protein